MIDKHGATPLLLNGQSASYIGQEKFDEAEAALQEAVEKDPNNVDTLINLIVLAQQTGKSTEVNPVRIVNYAGFFMHDAPGKTALLVALALKHKH